MIFTEAAHCALIIASELSYNKEKEGIFLSEIAERNNIPIDILKPIAKRLCSLDMIYCEESEGDHWMFLKKDPVRVSIYDIVMMFDGEIFSGRFVDTRTGRLFPKSRMSHAIHLERKHMVQYMRKRLNKLSLHYWAEMVLRTYHCSDSF